MSLACAKTVLIKPVLLLTSHNKVMYDYNKGSAGLIYTNSLLTLLPTSISLDADNEKFAFADEKVISEHNYFFEFSIIFNDKLQQLIAFFTSNDTSDEVRENNLTTKTSQQCIQSK